MHYLIGTFNCFFIRADLYLINRRKYFLPIHLYINTTFVAFVYCSEEYSWIPKKDYISLGVNNKTRDYFHIFYIYFFIPNPLYIHVHMYKQTNSGRAQSQKISFILSVKSCAMLVLWSSSSHIIQFETWVRWGRSRFDIYNIFVWMGKLNPICL